MRGDRPVTVTESFSHCRATPHARGSTDKPSSSSQNFKGYPACAGIDLVMAANLYIINGLPRMRGDRPVG